MNVVIRTDSSIEIGTGHVMRCVTLAKKLVQKGIDVSFICRNFEGNSNSYIKSEGFKVHTLSSLKGSEGQGDWDWVNENWERDARETKSIILKEDAETDLLIVDHYSLDVKWEKYIRLAVKRIMVIDDLANREHNCDLLLDQNHSNKVKDRYEKLVPESCIKLLGPDYVLLRDEFLNVDPGQIQRNSVIRNIIVYFGGADLTSETMKVLQALKELNRLDIEINVVVGESNPNKELVKGLCDQMKNTIFHCQVNNMAELMIKADLAIGAGGATTWERCYLQLPTLIITVAENQLEIAEDVAQKGAAVYLGQSNQVSPEIINKNILELISMPKKIKSIQKRCKALVDRERILEKKLSQEIIRIV